MSDQIGKPQDTGMMEIADNIKPINQGIHLKTPRNGYKTDKSAVKVAFINNDRVELSEKAMALRFANNAVKLVPDIREEKVGTIKHQVIAGTYEIRGKKIAVNMLKESMENNEVLNTIDAMV